MAKNWVSQEVYDAMKGLASDKNEYEYNDSVGNVSERDRYGKSATGKYDIINAYSPELVAKIKNSNAQQTRDLLKEYGVARDANAISNDIIAKKFGYENTKAKNPGADLSGYDASALYDELNAVDPSMATMLRNMSYQQAVDWKNGVMPSVNGQNGGTPVVQNPTDVHLDTHRTLNKHGDNIYSDVRSMYFDGNYGQNVRDVFSAYGDAKGNQAAANAASENSGNFDSFSDYNKKATDLSYKIAGENAIQRMREGYGNWGNDFIKTLGGELNTNAANFSDYDYKKDALAAEERMNDKTLESNLEGIKHTNLTNYDIAQLEADAQKYGYDVEKVIADINAEIAREGYISQEKIAEIQAKAKKVSGTTAGPGGYKPTLTASQVLEAMENGEINEGTVADYNAYYRTNYTVDEMKEKYGYPSEPILSDTEIAKLDELTNGGENPYGHTAGSLGLTTKAGADAYARIQALYDAGANSEIEMTAYNEAMALRKTSPKDAAIIELIFLGED